MVNSLKNTALKEKIIENYGTPCAVVDLDIVEKNIKRVQSFCNKANVANRPHIKTHKSPILAKLQLDAGAQGITYQKLGEAKGYLPAYPQKRASERSSKGCVAM